MIRTAFSVVAQVVEAKEKGGPQAGMLMGYNKVSTLSAVGERGGAAVFQGSGTSRRGRGHDVDDGDEARRIDRRRSGVGDDWNGADEGTKTPLGLL